MINRLAAITALSLFLLLPLGCEQNEQAVTQTSEVIVLDDAPIAREDPFDKEFLVDGERALRIGDGVAPPRLVSRGPRVKFPSSDRTICYSSASIIVVVDETGAVRETEIVSVGPAVEYIDGRRKELSADEARPLIEERESAILNWQYEPAMKDGEPVPVVVEGGWQVNCR